MALDYDISKYLLANVFKGGLNAYAPQFKQVEIYSCEQDNYARIVEQFTIKKCYSTAVRQLREYSPFEPCDIVVN